MTQMEGSITNDASHAGVKRDHDPYAWDASDDAYVEHRRAMKAEELRVKNLKHKKEVETLNYLSEYTRTDAAGSDCDDPNRATLAAFGHVRPHFLVKPRGKELAKHLALRSGPGAPAGGDAQDPRDKETHNDLMDQMEWQIHVKDRMQVQQQQMDRMEWTLHRIETAIQIPANTSPVNQNPMDQMLIDRMLEMQEYAMTRTDRMLANMTKLLNFIEDVEQQVRKVSENQAWIDSLGVRLNITLDKINKKFLEDSPAKLKCSRV
jgi:hypothetical protein